MIMMMTVVVKEHPLSAPGLSSLSTEGRLKVLIQPRPRQLMVGDTLQLECGAVGRPVPRYQWHRNGVPLPGASKRKLSVRTRTSRHLLTET